MEVRQHVWWLVIPATSLWRAEYWGSVDKAASAAPTPASAGAGAASDGHAHTGRVAHHARPLPRWDPLGAPVLGPDPSVTFSLVDGVHLWFPTAGPGATSSPACGGGGPLSSSAKAEGGPSVGAGAGAGAGAGGDATSSVSPPPLPTAVGGGRALGLPPIVVRSCGFVAGVVAAAAVLALALFVSFPAVVCGRGRMVPLGLPPCALRPGCQVPSGAVRPTPPGSATAPASTSTSSGSLFPVPAFSEFRKDLEFLVRVVHSAPVSTLAFRRLQLLEARFKLHQLLNSVCCGLGGGEDWVFLQGPVVVMVAGQCLPNACPGTLPLFPSRMHCQCGGCRRLVGGCVSWGCPRGKEGCCGGAGVRTWW